MSGKRAFIQSPHDQALRFRELADEIDSGPIQRLQFGLPVIDSVCTNTAGGKLIVILGRTSMGKTTLLNWLASVEVQAIRDRAAAAGVSIVDWPEYVCYVSAEEDAEDVGLNVTRAGFLLPEVISGAITTEELRHTADRMTGWPLWIASRRPTPLAETEMDDVGPLTIEHIWREISLIEDAYSKRPSAIYVDYLQIIETEKRTSGDTERIQTVVRGLNTVKKAVGCPVVVASQADRGVDDYAIPIPRIGDSYGSAYAEHDADIVLGLWMPKGSPPEKHGGTITYNETQYTVTDNLLVIQGLKQRKGKQRWREFAHIDHATGRIAPVTAQETF